MFRGTVQNLRPSALPMDNVLNWEVDDKSADSEGFEAELPQAGLDVVCNGSPGGIDEPHQQFTSCCWP
uniref:hypothetical protein n=1 Tax=Streptomyces chartreusis TaxID=1969 RepID=UPI003F49432C